MLESILKDFQKLANKEKASILSRFFKTGKGQYGYGDKFLGIVVPLQRMLSKKYKELPFKDIEKLLHSSIHEHRLTALFILIERFKKALKEGDKRNIEKIVKFYLSNTKNINNWDLVDLSAPNIFGEYLKIQSQVQAKSMLNHLAKSNNLWERRISILSTFTFIKNNKFDLTIQIAKILLFDRHDLIQKAVGWMLREVGKRDNKELINFLEKYSSEMPRTMLRYSIEKFPESKRKYFLNTSYEKARAKKVSTKKEGINKKSSSKKSHSKKGAKN